MKKEDLKTGMVVETRCGDKFVVINNIIANEEEYDLFSCYDNDLKNIHKFDSLDIIKIYKCVMTNCLFCLKNNTYLELIWERKEQPQLTERERAYLKAYSYDYEWIARDKDLELYTYKDKPFKTDYCWIRTSVNYNKIVDNLFNFIKWEDEEPYRIKDLLGEYDE